MCQQLLCSSCGGGYKSIEQQSQPSEVLLDLYSHSTVQYNQSTTAARVCVCCVKNTFSAVVVVVIVVVVVRLAFPCSHLSAPKEKMCLCVCVFSDAI